MGCCQKKKKVKENLIEEEEEEGKENLISSNDLSTTKNDDNENNTNANSEDDQAINVKVTYDDFQPIKLLGRGSFGEVLLVRLKANKKVYAMKILSKDLLKIQKQQSHTKAERDLMVKINCPFIVDIKSAFQDASKLYIVSEFMQGGDMFFHLHDGQIVIFNNQKTKFYIAELVLALEYIHSQNMVYRDLKPENILLDSYGHVKLTDFGLSIMLEEGEDKAFTICGTPQYLAPEVLLKRGYDKAVDWWSLGCVMYEMLTGRLPFPIKRGVRMNFKVYERKVDFPKNMNKDAKDLIQKLLVVNPDKRLGQGLNGSQNIKNHPFFKDINWEDAKKKKIKPPFIPNLKNDTDLKYFDREFTDEPIDGPKRKKTIRDREREPSNEYNGFTYVAPSVSKELMNVDQNNSSE